MQLQDAFSGTLFTCFTLCMLPPLPRAYFYDRLHKSAEVYKSLMSLFRARLKNKHYAISALFDLQIAINQKRWWTFNIN